MERDVNYAWPGMVCAERVAQRMGEIGPGLDGWRGTSDLEIRHPFLSLPLATFCLSLDRRLRSNFSHPKPVLRRAMRGIVPSEILERRTKGSLILPRVCWSFRHERRRLSELMRESVLADLGAVEPSRLLEAVDECAAGRGDARHLYFALSLETWLSTHTPRRTLLAA